MKETKDYIKLLSFTRPDIAAYVMLEEKCLRLFYKDTLIDIGFFGIKVVKGVGAE